MQFIYQHFYLLKCYKWYRVYHHCWGLALISFWQTRIPNPLAIVLFIGVGGRVKKPASIVRVAQWWSCDPAFWQEKSQSGIAYQNLLGVTTVPIQQLIVLFGGLPSVHWEELNESKFSLWCWQAWLNRHIPTRELPMLRITWAMLSSAYTHYALCSFLLCLF